MSAGGLGEEGRGERQEVRLSWCNHVNGLQDVLVCTMSLNGEFLMVVRSKRRQCPLASIRK